MPREGCLTRVGFLVIDPPASLFPFCVLLLSNIKPTTHMPVPSGLPGLSEHSDILTKPPDIQCLVS